MPKCSKIHAKSIQNPSKIDPRASPERLSKMIEKGCRKVGQKGPRAYQSRGTFLVKNLKNDDQKIIENPTPKKSCFSMPKGSQNEPKDLPKSSKNRSEKRSQKNVHKSIKNIIKSQCTNLRICGFS